MAKNAALSSQARSAKRLSLVAGGSGPGVFSPTARPAAASPVRLRAVPQSRVKLPPRVRAPFEVYLNGVLATKVRRFTTEYTEQSIAPEARATLKSGADNLIAVHCKQTGGGQYIDVGIVDLVPSEGGKSQK